MIRKFIGRVIARYEHALRRAQLPIWATIAINTFLEVVFDTVDIVFVLTIYAIGMIGAVILGYTSQKTEVGSEIRKTQWRIEEMPLWYDILEYSALKYAYWYKQPIEVIKEELGKAEKRLRG